MSKPPPIDPPKVTPEMLAAELEATRALRSEVLLEAGQPQEHPGGRASSAGRKPSVRISPDGREIPNEIIVENIRTLMLDNWTDGEIKRAMVKRYGGLGRSFTKHISVARKRNLEVLSKPLEVAKSESIQNCVRTLRNAKKQHMIALRDLDRIQEELDEIYRPVLDRQVTRADVVNGDRYAELRNEQAVILGLVKQWASEQDKHQLYLDRLVGAHAPLKDKEVASAEQKAESDSPTEPLTADDNDAKIADLLAKIRERAAMKAKASVSTPSEN